MFFRRLCIISILLIGYAALLFQWNQIMGFDPLDLRWWVWLFEVIIKTNSFPPELLWPSIWTGVGTAFMFIMAIIFILQPSTRTLGSGPDANKTHGSARFATWREIKAAGVVKKTGVVVGGFKRGRSIKFLRHDGPEHILAFQPTRSGKGVALVINTLLSWLHSVLVLDIKGENYALTAGWRQLIGQRVLRFEPAALEGSVRYNPLAEVRIGTPHEIADCQNLASMIIDPDGKGLKDYWMQAAWSWIATGILHVLYRVQKEHGRTANLSDVNTFMSLGDDDGESDITGGDEGFDQLLEDMAMFEHGSERVNTEIRKGAGTMLKKASQERSGVHSSATVQLSLYSDPIVAANTSESDFKISDLMNGAHPTSLYIVISPSDIERMKPLTRILINQVLTRLTASMEFEGGAQKPTYNYKLALILDEFTSQGKLEIFEKGLGFLAGYGLKAFIIIQDLAQLQKAYGRDENITSNCHVQIATAPNKIETAKLLSEKCGKTTVVQVKRSRSHGKGGASVSDSMSEIARPLLTQDECMSLPALREDWVKRTFGKSWFGKKFGRMIPGDMLIFVAGNKPIYGKQRLFFQDPVMKKRAAIPAPAMESRSTFSTPLQPENNDQNSGTPLDSALKIIDGKA